MNDPGGREARLAARLPLAPGVYRFRDAAGGVLYVGRAVSLRRRVASYWGDLGDRAHLAPMVRRIASLEAVVCDSAHEAAWLERNVLQARLPPWNRSPSGGQEVEVWVRIGESSGPVVVHQPSPGTPHFGPYLGGRKVRRAVSGLRRIPPERMAAVLDRDPESVAWLRAHLTGRRDAASARLAFEFAGRLQEEIEALDWVTAEQKVTRATPANLDVHGWADGMLISFTIRGGRLTDWTQRRCDAASASGHVDRTPPEWAAFARRNAELAARLAG